MPESKISAASCGDLRFLRGTNHFVFARLPGGKPQGIRSRANSTKEGIMGQIYGGHLVAKVLKEV